MPSALQSGVRFGHAVSVIPLPVRDHLRCASLEWAPARITTDADAVERALANDKEQP